MHIARAIFVGLLGMMLASAGPVQALAASHQAAGQEQKAEQAEKAKKPAGGMMGGMRRHTGTVKAVDPAAGTLTVTEKEGDAEVSVGEMTMIKKGKESLKLSDLKPGDEVTVMYMKQDGKDTARSVMVKGK